MADHFQELRIAHPTRDRAKATRQMRVESFLELGPPRGAQRFDLLGAYLEHAAVVLEPVGFDPDLGE
ncbi:MAG: hypothetical protein AAF799_13685 [Myxococcota bacterium]